MTERKINIFDIPLDLHDEDEGRRQMFEKMINGAQERIIKFALTHQWEKHVLTPLIDRFYVCNSKEQFDLEIKKAFNLEDGMTIPPTYSAVIANGVLLAVPPETYASNYSEGQEKDAYEKLLAHELAHELHIRILEGNEDQMGPRWFFEGFALYAAKQFDQAMLELTKEDIQMILSNQPVSYVYYRRLMDKLLLHMDLKEAINQAREAKGTFCLPYNC